MCKNTSEVLSSDGGRKKRSAKEKGTNSTARTRTSKHESVQVEFKLNREERQETNIKDYWS